MKKRHLLALLVFATAMFAQTKRGYRPDDFYSVETATDPRISPDGKLIAFTVSVPDRKSNARRSAIWLVPSDGSRAPWQLSGDDNATSPRWSPDGKSLAFLSSRPDARSGARQPAQIFVLPMSGGEARRISNLKNAVTALEWSPNGGSFAAISRSGASDQTAPGKERSDVRDYTNLIYKFDGSGFYDDRRPHIFVVDAAKGDAKQITFGDQRNDSDVAWSPDGGRIAYVSQKTEDTFMHGSELMVVPAAGGESRKISKIDAGVSRPRWSPDGRSIAYVGSGDDTLVPKIYVSPSTGGEPRVASKAITYVTELDWSEDGKKLFFAYANRGEHTLAELQVATGEATAVVSRGTVTAFDIDEKRGLIAYVRGDDTHPGDVYASDPKGANSRQLSHLNAAFLSTVEIPPIERMPYKGADGLDVEGFLLKPAGWEPGKKYPAILTIHGGPNGMFGPVFNHDALVFAGQGWAVILTNPRGSSGYGEEYQRKVEKEWGGKAYQDIMAGVDAALAKYPWIDPDRLGVRGHSYGGFMTDWIVGHTNRFKAAITMAGISNFLSVEGTRDAAYGHARDFGGDIYENFDTYWKYSPIRYANQVKTPTMVMQGEADQRVPMEQSEQFFRALRHFNVPAEFVIFPREGHSLRSEPKHTVELGQYQVYWFKRWVEGDVNAKRPVAE
jgi:dipeptidyl aminopeptidase/acylaminoacyl peptidase